MSLRRTISIALAVVLFSSPAFAQRGRRGGGGGGDQRPSTPPVWRGKGEVKGNVTDEAGKGVGDAKVTLVHSALNSGFFVMTKKNGEFQAKDMKGGEWHLQVEAQGYAVAKQTLNLTEDNKNAPIAVKLVKDNSNELLAKAEELFKQGNMPAARAEYLKVREIHPELAAVNRAIAFTYAREQNFGDALKYLDMALADMPNDTLMLQLAAGSALEMKNVPKAMEYAAKIDENTLPDAEPLLNIAAGVLRAQKWAEAIALMDRTIAKFPNAPDAYFFRGLAKLNSKDSAGAKTDLEKFVSMAPAADPQLAQAKDILSKMK